MKLEGIRERLVLILIGLLPLHAFLVTVGTKMIAGPGQSPLPILAIWKEALLGIILIIAIVEWVLKLKMENGKWKMDAIDICIGGLVAWSLLQPVIFNFPFSIFHYAFGFKYDFLPLVAFLVLRRVPWSSSFARTAVAVLLGVGIIVSVYGIASMFLPMSWFTALGYSDLHSLYVPRGPLAAFQQIESIGIRRMQSTFSGPNQLGLWLLIPWSIALIDLARRRSFAGLPVLSFVEGLVCSLLVVSIVLTFSRSAWIAAAVMGGVVAWKYLSRQQLLIATCSLLTLAVMAVFAFPNIILRATSSAGHIERPLQALRIMKEHPFGLGLGTAGPASNRFSDACIDLPAGSNASWAHAHPELCVFVAGQQIQPTDRTCACPLLPENWYLQIGVELGWIGFMLYLVLVFVLLRRLRKSDTDHGVLLMFLGISIAAFFLHAWEDSAVAYTVWVLMTTVLSLSLDRSHLPD